MHYLRKAFIFQFVLIYSYGLQAQAVGKQLLVKPFQNKVFIKEMGQFSRNARELKIPLQEPVVFGVENAEFSAYFTTHGIIFQFPERRNIEEKDREKIKGEPEEKSVETIWHSAQMLWINSNASVEIISEQKVSEYYNYGGFANDSTINFVPAYKKIKYVNLYPGVDAEFELSEDGGIKYKFLVQPNVVIPAMAFQWKGISNINTDEKGDLHIRNKFNPISVTPSWQLVDHSPNAFTSSSHTNFPVKYSVTDSIVQFQFSSGNISSPEGIIIDPWITNPNFPGLNRAYDIQEDSIGNVFVQGNYSQSSSSNAYHVQKYSPTGTLIWTYITYSVFLGDIAVDNPGNVYIIGGYCTGKRQKLDPSGVQQWSLSGLCEEWRLAFNYSKTTLAVCGYFVNPGGNNLAKLDMATGAISSQIAYNEETRSISTDCNGDMYSLHLPSSNLRKTNANFTPGGVAPSGLSLIYAGTGYAYNPDYSPSVFQGFNGNVIQGPYVYIYDGTKLRRFNKATLTPVNDVIVPNGVNYQCSGLAADACGNIYAGATNSIVKYDSALNYVSTIATSGAVYDILLSSYGNILACGQGFVGSFSTNCIAPPQLTATATSTNASCHGGGSSVIAAGGLAPYSYLWQPGGQTTTTITNLVAGTYTYTVTDPFCHSYEGTTIILPVAPLLLTTGAVSNESCPNTLNGSITVSAIGGTAPYLYSWNTNPVQNSPAAAGLSAGTYIATVFDVDSCKDTVNVVITRHPDPVAVFGSTRVCKGNATQYTDSSTTVSGIIQTWSWNFGDGTPLNSTQNPPYTYLNAGNYSATLIVNNNFGCADTITKQVKVYYNPTAGFIHSDVCFKDSMHFTNTSSVDASTSIASYLWDFGDGGPTSNLKNPAHDYASHGIYNVTMVTTTVDLCSDAVTHSVNVFDPPHSTFTFTNTCFANAALFTNTTISPTMGSTASWSWNFGDSSPLNTNVWNPQHLYSIPGNFPGNYQVILITHSSNLGCADTFQTAITMFPMPFAKFGFANVCLHEPMNFHDSSIISSGSIAGWSWNFGDASPINTVQYPSHMYASPGTYVDSLIVTTDNGCKDTAVKSVVVHPLPLVQFSRVNECDGTPVPFTDHSSIFSTDTIQSYSWNFGDGSSINVNQNTTHQYGAAGLYPVQLVVVSTFGCKDSITKTSIVNPNPVVKFKAIDTIGCEPLCVSFQDLSVIVTGGIVQWLWNPGDGSPISHSQNFVHCYHNNDVFKPDTLTISLMATSDSGCVSTGFRNDFITVYPNPVANFSVQPGSTTITDPVITFTNLSTGATIWHWNFGDNITSFIQHPAPHTYQDTGTYVVTLITSTQYNCVDSSFKTVIIEPDFLFYIPNAFTPDGDGINDAFTGKGIFIKEFEMSIYDRWGNLIFFSDDINKPWDGTANHGTQIAQRDVYVYSIKITDYNRKKHSYNGTITLLR